MKRRVGFDEDTCADKPKDLTRPLRSASAPFRKQGPRAVCASRTGVDPERNEEVTTQIIFLATLVLAAAISRQPRWRRHTAPTGR